MSRLLAIVLVLAGLPSLAWADEPKTVDPWAAEDVQDIIYLAEARPVLIRVHLYVDGQPYMVQWHEYLRKLFKYLDRDDNGYLDRVEVTRMPAAVQVQTHVEGSGYFQSAPFPARLQDVDANGDGKVTFEEFVRYYDKNDLYPVRIVALPGPGLTSSALSDTLFRLLDTDKDGKLSKAELRAAQETLRKYDLDDDELLTTQELQSTPQYYPAQGQTQPGQPGQPTGQGLLYAPFILVPREQAGQRVAQRLKVARSLVERFDKDRNGKLSREEIGLPKELFDQLRPDAKGEVDAARLLRWLLVLPDVEVTVRVGKTGEREAPLEAIERPTALSLHKVGPNTLTVPVGRTNLSLARSGSDVSGIANASGYYRTLFRTIDKDRKGFLTAKQLETPNAAFLKQILLLADRNEDGKLTEEEVLEYHAVMAGGVDHVASLTFTDYGHSLFEILDVNRDGKLSIRELRRAWDRLAAFDADGDGCLSKGELPRQCQLLAARGTMGVPGTTPPGVPANTAQPNQTPPMPKTLGAGPEWFRRMDVNGDGDVSPREFLGSPEDFARIDTDGDGLISVEEAIKADAWFRDKLKPKK